MPRPDASEAVDGSGHALRALVAGEVTWAGAAAMFEWALALVVGAGQTAEEGKTAELSFLDCGAGHGRAIALFAALYGRAHGYEIRTAIAATAAATLASLQQPMGDMSPEGAAAVGSASASFGYTCSGVSAEAPIHREWAGVASVECGDMFAQGISWDADVILVNATGFDDWLVAESVRKLEEPSPADQTIGSGRRRRAVLSLSQPLRSPCLRLEGQRMFALSWGQCTTYLYSRA
jgi:hypothetical protein